MTLVEDGSECLIILAQFRPETIRQTNLDADLCFTNLHRHPFPSVASKKYFVKQNNANWCRYNLEVETGEEVEYVEYATQVKTKNRALLPR